MRNNKLYKANRTFMWANILLGLFVIILVVAMAFLFGWITI